MNRTWLLAPSLLLIGALTACDDDGGATPPRDAAPLDAAAPDLGGDLGDDCNPGTEDCRCLQDGTCRLDHLTCHDGRCVDRVALCDPAIERCPPPDPQCYTPCRGDLIAADGARRVCSPEGLMPGCLHGSVCDRGACVPEAGAMKQSGPAPGTCARETDCPDFQTCILGRCYSDCQSDGDCGEATACHRHVCRAICGVGVPCPDPAEACHDGVCLPLSPAGAPTPLAADEGFEVDATALRFTSSIPEARFAVYNTGAAPLTLTIRKDEQRTVDDTGRQQRITDDPLLWLHIGSPTPARVQRFDLTLAPGERADIQLAAARGPDLGRWEGRLAIEAPGLGARHVNLRYDEELRGRWIGKAYAFASFPDGARPHLGEYPLDDWRADRDDLGHLDAVPNAFLRAWGRFRAGDVDLDLTEMAALIDATLTGSWQTPRVRELCREAGFDENTLCAPYGGAGSASVIPYTTRGDVDRVPQGVVAMDLALDLTPATGPTRARLCPDDAHCFTGRIDSATALQYAGDPELVITFQDDPATCARTGGAGCTVDLDRLQAEIGVGFRHRPDSRDFGLGGVCAGPNQLVERPWLVPGFAAPGYGARLQILEPPPPGTIRECHGTVDERGGDGDPGGAANPIPDGQSRIRRLELIDGQLIEQHVMILILRETVDAFHGGEPLATYLYVVLEKTPTDPAELDPQGNPVNDQERRPIDMGPRCDRQLTQDLTGSPDLDFLDTAELSDLALTLVTGGTGAAPAPLPPGDDLHTVCIWTEDAIQDRVGDDPGFQEPAPIRREVIDAGPGGDRPCFPGAEIVYFTTRGGDPAAWPCNQQSPESCLAELDTRVARGDRLRFNAQAQTLLAARHDNTNFDLVHRCDDPERNACSDDRFDLTAGKVFGVADGVTSHFSALGADVAQAFRYKTWFADRIGGAEIGFAPAICRPGATLDPYCYDPSAIEAARARLDCALDLYDRWLQDDIDLTAPARIALRTALTHALDGTERPDPFGDPILEPGFERLYAELLIMLGDDAYTAAFASRFDLAQSARLAFEGSLFEDDGIDLTGPAGYEMYKLHQATEYYGLVLDRFFSMSARLWQSLAAPDGERYVTAGTVTTWIDRVVRASTQSANASSEIARRYRTMNRPDLARRVLIRAYTRAWQESLVLRALMTEITTTLAPDDLPGIEAAIDDAQTRYRVAMLDMQARFHQIGDRIDVFGLPEDYIPFPALDEGDVNGFEVMLDRALQRMALALEDEDTAIASRRDFDVDAASFQSELVTLRNGYQERLGHLCGTFLGEDGRVYPAIARYAHLHPDLAGLDDPCGAAGNGELWLAGGDLQGRELALQRIRQEVANTQAAMTDAQQQVADHCDLLTEDVNRFLETQGVVDGLEADQDRMNSAIRQLDKVHAFVTEITARVNDLAESDTFVEGIIKSGSNAGWIASSAVNLIATSVLEIAINANGRRIRELERAYEARAIGRECDYLQADLVYTLRDLHRELLLAEYDVLDAIWNIQVEFARIQALANERARLEAEWRDNERLAIDIAAARSDPNVRIFKNDAIINADRSFDRALAEAWKATRTFEYYAAQSYPDRDKLFLIRLVNRGDINLRRYLQDLEDSFHDFEQQYGNPDTRLAIVSVKDDILRVPRYGSEDDRVLTAQERTDLFRAMLKDPARLDDRGALELRFSTAFDQLSPLTANHKILFIEIGLYGQDLGDPVGRVYLSQRGTGVTEGTDDTRRFFAFPPRTAVMNPFFNAGEDDIRLGQDANGSITGPTRSIYRSYRFRERPFVQTDWSLVLDRRNEEVNRDISLDGIDDILVYIFYTDFTP